MSDVTVEFISRVRGLGIELSAEGDQLRFNAPAGAMTPALRTEIAQRKPELLRLLRVAGPAAREPLPPMAPAPRSDTMPLSHDEQRLWFLHHELSDPSIYNVAAATRIRGPFDLERLRNAFAAVMQRHEILRSGFLERDGAPVRVIASACAVPLVVEEWSSAVGEPLEPRIERRLTEAAKQPFALAVPPLFRVTCLRLGERDHVVAFVAHHLVCDEWSVQLLRGEVEAFYRVEKGRTPAELPALPLQYADYADWQCRTVTSSAMDGHREYWRRQMQDAPPSIELPFDRGRAKQPSHRGGLCEFVLDHPTADALERIGASQHATPFMVWLAAFSVFLHRISGQRDFVVGTPLARRERPEVQPLIGFFLNTLPVRATVDEAHGFREILKQTRATVLQAFEHGDLPLDQIRMTVPNPQQSPGSPLFSVMFVLRDDQQRAWKLPDTTSAELPVKMESAKMELTLFLDRLDDRRMRGAFEFSLDLFDASSMDRAAGQLKCLFDAMARSPDSPIGKLDLLPTDQRRQILVDFNPARAPYERDATVHALFERQALQTPHVTALICEGRELDYAELDRRANQLAHRLRELNVDAGTRVAVLLHRSIEFVVSVLATLKAGAAYVPLETHSPGERLRFMLEDTAARVLITHGAPPSGIGVSGVTTLDLAQDSAAIARYAATNPDGRSLASDPAYIMYTSGSTGRPKGVVIPHRGILRLVRGQTYAPFAPGQRFLLHSPPAFDASTFEFWGPLLNGATCVIFPERRPEFEHLETTIREHGVTCMWLTAGLFNQIIEQRPSVLATVRHVLTGGEALSVPHVRRALELLPDLRLTNGYGPTESTTFACAYAIPPTGDWPGRSVPVGRPIANTRAYVLDMFQQPVPVGVPGELYLGGDGLALGYLNRPELDAERFVSDPFSTDTQARLYRTGDRCRWLADGNIEFLGRLDDQVKIRGFRVEPGEIKTALESHPAIGAAVVVVLEDSPGDRRLIAYFVCSDGAKATANELRQHLRVRLPDYMVPAAFVPLERLPLTVNGKVDHRALPAPGRVSCSAPESPAPRHTIEIELVSIWKRMLKLEHVGITDNFFEVGGHSLLALRMVFEIERRFGRKLSLQSFVSAPTIEQISQRLISSAQSSGEIPELRGHGSGAPLFHVPGMDGVGLLPSAVVRLLDGERPYYDALQYPGMDGSRAPLDRIEDIAAAVFEQIRRVRPHGPYCLNGFCFGGLVAYEIARKLEMAGEEIEALILWDTQPARCFRPRPLRKAVTILRRRMGARDRRVRLRALALELVVRAKATVKKIIAWIAARASRLRPATRRDSGAALTPDEISSQVQAAGRRALAAYRPGPYHGRVDLFQTGSFPNQRIWSEPIPLNGWHGIICGPIRTHVFDCGHNDLLQEPVVSEVARRTLACLHAAERESGISEPATVPERNLVG